MVSIVIPCWNAEKYLSELLDNIIAQTYSDWACYVVDDGSEDSSVPIVLSYANIDSRIHSIIRNRLPKGGQTCRNIGIQCSKNADYLVFFDADDLIAPNCLEQRVSYMEKNSDLDFAIFPARSFVASPSEPFNNDAWGFHLYEDSLKAMINMTLPMVGWTNIYRVSSVIKNSLVWDEQVKSLQDSDWNIQCLLKGLNYSYAESGGAEFDYYYRISSVGSVSKKISTISHLDSHLYFLNKEYSSLTETQKDKYDLDYRSNLFSFIEKYELSFFAICKLLSTDYAVKHPLFSLRVLLWKCLKRRAKQIIFHNEVNYRRERYQEWEELKHKVLKDYGKRHAM